MDTRLLFVHALSPLHAGTGQGLGFIDLPVAREKASQIPYLPGSSLKGVLREACGEGELCTRIFGPQTQSGEDHAGAASFGDARLLLLPVRSLWGVFAWVTSPFLLQRLHRDARANLLKTIPGEIPLPTKDENCWLATEKSQLIFNNSVVLEDLKLNVSLEKSVTAWADWLGQAIFPSDAHWQQLLKDRLCVVSNDVLSFLLETATEVSARIKLEDDTKTVAQGALWYEEALPAETVLVSLITTRQVRATPTEVFETLTMLTDKCLQFGGKATVGHGLCRLSLQ